VRGVSFIVKPSRLELIKIKELIDGGIIRPIVSPVFPLAQARQAFERGIAGHPRGKLVLLHSAEIGTNAIAPRGAA
jgi:NADPH:quinone reductase-like Zn-dependent oxidoreductase